MDDLSARVYAGEGQSPLFEVFSPNEENRFATWLITFALLIGAVATAIGLSLHR